MESGEDEYFENHREIQTIRENGQAMNLEYSINGELLAYTVGDTLKLYTSATGALCNVITAEIHKMKFFQNNTLLHTVDDTIYYLSVHDNRYMRRFSSHSGPIESLSVDSSADIFMSAGLRGACLWDIRMDDPIKRISAANHIGALGLDGQYALCNNNFIKIFDTRTDSGPVTTEAVQPGFYKRMWYTNNGEYISLAGTNNYTFVNRNGETQCFIIQENENDGDTAPDSGTLLCSSNRYVFAYRISDRKRIGTLETTISPNIAVRANPSFPQFACATPEALKIIQF